MAPKLNGKAMLTRRGISKVRTRLYVAHCAEDSRQVPIRLKTLALVWR